MMQVTASVLVDVYPERAGLMEQLSSQLGTGRGALTGRVVRAVQPGTYLLALGGRTLSLVSTRPLDVGATFHARLVDGRLVLDFGSGSAFSGSSAPGGARVAVRTLGELVADLGLPVDQRTMATVQSLLRAGVPLTGEAVQLFGQYVGIQDPAQSPLLALLIQKGIAVNASVLETAEALMRQGGQLSKILLDVFSRGGALASGLGSSPAGVALTTLLEHLRRQITEVGADDVSQRWAQAVQQGIARSGIFREARFALAIGQGGSLPGTEDLKSLLLELEAWARSLKEKAPPVQGLEAEAEQFQQRVRSALSQIEAMQLSSTRPPWENRQVWFLEFPFWIQGRLESVRLTIEGGLPRRRKQMALPVFVNLYLELSELGPLRVSLVLQRHGVEGQILSERPATVALLEKAIPSWLENRQREADGTFSFVRLVARKALSPQELSPPALLGDNTGLGWCPARVDVEA